MNPRHHKSAIAELDCDYELGEAELYSVKWYHDDQGFYRFYPALHNPKQVFPIPGLEVDLQMSDQRKVRLASISASRSGRLRCEVTSEGPMFRTVAEDSPMTVVKPPVVSWVTPGNDSLILECSPDQPHLPGLTNTFYLNGSSVRRRQPGHLLHYTFNNNQTLNVSCTKHIAGYHFKSQEISLRLRVEGSVLSLFIK